MLVNTPILEVYVQNFANFDLSEWLTATKTSSWCVFIYIRASLWKTKGGYGCCTYRRGLSALFVPDSWHCEGLEHGTDEGERFPRLFYIFLSTIDWIVRPTGVWGTHISRIGTWFMRDNLLNARFTNRDAPSPGSLPNYAAHAPMFTRYSKREYRHPPALAHLLHPRPWFFPRSFRQHQYRKLPQCIQIGYNSVSFLELCFHPVVYSFRIPLQAY